MKWLYWRSKSCRSVTMFYDMIGGKRTSTLSPSPLYPSHLAYFLEHSRCSMVLTEWMNHWTFKERQLQFYWVPLSCQTCFLHLNVRFLKIHNKSVRVEFNSPFYRWWNWSSNTQVLSSGTRILTHSIFWLRMSSPASWPTPPPNLLFLRWGNWYTKTLSRSFQVILLKNGSAEARPQVFHLPFHTTS